MTITPKFHADVKNNELVFHNPKKFADYLANLSGTLEVIVRYPKKTTSDPQRAYLFGVAYKILSDEIGLSVEELHHSEPIAKLRMNYAAPLPTPKSVSRQGMSTIEFNEYKERLQQFAAEQNIFIPDPDDVVLDDDETMKNADKTIDNAKKIMGKIEEKEKMSDLEKDLQKESDKNVREAQRMFRAKRVDKVGNVKEDRAIDLLKKSDDAKDALGEEKFYEILKKFDKEEVEDFGDLDKFEEFIGECRTIYLEIKEMEKET